MTAYRRSMPPINMEVERMLNTVKNNSSLKILMYPPRGHARSNAKNDGNDYIGGNDYTNFSMNTAQKHVGRITKEGG